MRINIAASHRFHLLDLARELQNQGHQITFYSYVTKARCVKFGLKPESINSLFYWIVPFLILERIFKRSFLVTKWKNLALDRYLAWFMKPCDVYIALGTVYEQSILAAKQKYGAITILEWGSKHIQEQRRILDEIPGQKAQPEYFTKRSMNGYGLADYIAVPSNHVVQSFVDRGVAPEKLLRNPYGVDLSMFRATRLVEDDIYDLIMVGGWSYRKGCDLLIDVCRKNKFRLLHVGSIVDMEFPDDPYLTHHDHVDQSELIHQYARARVFVLPSREEGLAMVQAQALVCGLPIVCSKNTGATDLGVMLTDSKWIVEMPELNTANLASGIFNALELSRNQEGLRAYCNDAFVQLSWAAYAGRYNKSLIRVTK